MRVLPTISGSANARLVRYAGVAATMLYRDLPTLSVGPRGPAVRNHGDFASEVDALDCLDKHMEKRVSTRESFERLSILISDLGFGSSPRTRPEARIPERWRFRVIVAPRFGPAILSQAVQQGILLIPLAEQAIHAIADWITVNPRAQIVADLESQLLELPGSASIAFTTHPRLRQSLLLGLDELDELRQYASTASTGSEPVRGSSGHGSFMLD
jgi:3-isopropylmalate dehydratase small subunit